MRIRRISNASDLWPQLGELGDEAILFRFGAHPRR